jgi:hypothetical protein
MTYAGDISRNFDTVGKPYSGKLPKRGIRLFGGIGLHDGAHASLLRGIVAGGNVLFGVEPSAERGRLGLFLQGLSRIVNELVKCWQAIAPPFLLLYIIKGNIYAIFPLLIEKTSTVRYFTIKIMVLSTPFTNILFNFRQFYPMRNPLR